MRARSRTRTNEWRADAGEARVAKLAPGWGRRGRARSEVRLLKGAIDVAKEMVKRVRRKRNVALRERVGVSSSSSDGRPGGVMIGISKTVDRHGLIIHLACRESNALAAGESNSDRQSGALARSGLNQPCATCERGTRHTLSLCAQPLP